MNSRTAVVLCNLGGPDSLDAVPAFLFNLFSDPDIFQIPLAWLTQRPLAFLLARRRSAEAQRAYAAIGGRSPLLENTQRQAEALRRLLDQEQPGGFDVHVCMRYWHPLAEQVVATLKQERYAAVVLLPLYPQYSRTTSGSARNEFLRQCERQGYRPQVRFIEHWYTHLSYQQGIVETISNMIPKFSQPDPERITLLLSAHGLPQKIVDAGDPYEQQVRATYEAVKKKLGWPHTALCYQSRVGPLQWLRPYTAEVIRAQAAAGVQQMLVYPIAFVSDHVETLYELGIAYAKLAAQVGIREYHVVPALNDHARLISALKDLVLETPAT